MNTDQLRSFVTVAATGSFRAAATKLHISQPALSARIQALEDRLNQRLFERSRRGVVLTSAGRRFEKYAVAALQILEQGRQETAMDSRFRGVLSLGLQFYLWEAIAAEWIDRMNEYAPTLALKIEPDFSDGIMAELVSGVLDMGVLFEPRLASGIEVEHLSDEQLVLVCSNSDDVEANWQSSFVAVYWGTEHLQSLAKAFPDLPQPRLTVGLSTLGLSHILRNGGSAYLLARTAAPLIREGTLRIVSDAPQFVRPVYIAYRSAMKSSPDLMAAISSVRSVMDKAAP